LAVTQWKKTFEYFLSFDKGETAMVTAQLADEPTRTKDEAAAENRGLLEEHGVVLLNLIGEPGAGKTAILEKILPFLKSRLSVAVIGADMHAGQIENIAALGVDAVPIDSSGSPGLDASMVNKALRQLPLGNLDLVVVDNVGSLVFPAEVDLGGDLKIVVTSVIESMDTPERYPNVFKHAAVVLISKIDLLPYEEYSLGLYIEQLVAANESLKIFPVSALKGEGIEEFSVALGRMVWKRRRHLPT